MTINPDPAKVERNTRILAMWDEGKSASEIARAIGGLSRNAVIGIVHRRKGTAKRAKASPPPEPRLHPVDRRSPMQKKLEGIAKGRAMAVGDVDAPRARDPITGVQAGVMPRWEAAEPGAELLEALGARMCRWPVGEGAPQLFCAAAADDDETYCPDHKAKARARVQPPNLTRMPYK